MSKVVYYLQRADDAQVWEQVDEYVFDNAARVVQKDGSSPRYSGNAVTVRDGKVEINAALTEKELGVVCRFLGVRAEAGVHPNGFLQTPEYVKIKRGRGFSVHEVGSKVETKADAPDAPSLAGQRILGVVAERRAS